MFFFFDMDKTDKIPSFDEMMIPLLHALKNSGGSATVKELNRKTQDLMELPDKVRKAMHSPSSNLTEVEYRLTWTRSYLKKAGIIINSEKHVWKFADGFDTGKIDDTDVEAIKRQVRNDRLKALESPKLTNFESGLAFEKFVISSLEEYVKNQNKIILRSSGMFFDARLPQGIDDINEPINVELKYNFTKNVKQFAEQIKRYSEKHILSADILLVIVSDSLSDGQKQKIISELKAPRIKQIIIWDYDDLLERTGVADSPYLENPKKALLEDAVRSLPTPEETAAQKEALLASLKSAYDDQDVTLCLGAGVSMSAGVPLWNELINKMLVSMIAKIADDKKLDKSIVEKLNDLAISNKEDSSLTQIRYIKTSFDESEYKKLLHKSLYNSNKLNADTELLEAIARISTPRRNHIGVKSIVTYNFDDLLEQQFDKIDHNVVYREKDEPSNSDLNIYHVHGYLPRKLNDSYDADSEIVFSEEDYHRIYRDSFCWSNIAQLNAFKNSTCLFIGCSLTDPNLRRLLDVAVKNKDKPRHFAFMKSKTFNAGSGDDDIIKIYSDIDKNLRDSYFRSIGINVIWVDDFDEIPALLCALVS